MSILPIFVLTASQDESLIADTHRLRLNIDQNERLDSNLFGRLGNQQRLSMDSANRSGLYNGIADDDETSRKLEVNYYIFFKITTSHLYPSTELMSEKCCPVLYCIRDEIVLLIGGFPRFWDHFRHFCDFPRSVIKVWGDGGGGCPLVNFIHIIMIK